MRVGILCEASAVVRKAFEARGHDAWSCDILPRPGNHIRGDALAQDWRGFDLLICHPPCTYLAVCGAKHFKRPRRKALQEAAVQYQRGGRALYNGRKGCSHDPDWGNHESLHGIRG